MTYNFGARGWRYTVPMVSFFKIFFLLSTILFPFSAYAISPTLSIFPQSIMQGEPLEIIVQPATLSQIQSISFNGKKLGVFLYKNKPTAFVGIGINQKPSVYTLSVVLSDGTTLEKSVLVSERKKIKVAFSIPEKLGGNSTSSQQTLVSTLAEENQQLIGLPTQAKASWTNKFLYPLSHSTVTDGYGYIRQTGNTSILHKGTDFQAPEGTPVIAMNRGIVRLAKEFRNYGNTVIIDHGLGLMTFYMHLSKINVTVGELVPQGKIIGQSGHTGYADQPHLHLTVRMNAVSIDPIKFMALFK
jgi:murein DD-endopeptidase MepM/ murein hydrolase activator NlpD